MSKEPLKKLYTDLHVHSVKLLLKRIKDGTATAADLSVARALLRDNGIDINAGNKKTPLLQLAEELPFDPEAEAATG